MVQTTIRRSKAQLVRASKGVWKKHVVGVESSTRSLTGLGGTNVASKYLVRELEVTCRQSLRANDQFANLEFYWMPCRTVRAAFFFAFFRLAVRRTPQQRKSSSPRESAQRTKRGNK